MMQGLYSSSSGMKTHTAGLGIIGNNLANVNTIGFKQQMMLFDNLGNKDLPTGSAYELEVKQVGMGSSIGYTRTLFTQGGLAEADNITDLAIAGKGFFQVSEGDELFYTKAGNFNFDEHGIMRSPSGHALSGIPFIDGVEASYSTDIQVDTVHGDMITSPAKATSSIKSAMNIFTEKDTFSDPANPYFSMIQSWDGTQDPPLPTGQSVGFHYYDSAGAKQNLQVFYDKGPILNGEQTYEYAVTMDPELDARAGYTGTESAGLLATGTMTFNPAGQLKTMNSFSPTGGDLTTPAAWTLSPLNGGVPSISLTLPGQAAQNISLDFGVTSSTNSWTTNEGNPVTGVSAASIGTSFAGLPGMSDPTLANGASTSLETSSALVNLEQDGYPLGDISTLHIDTEGILHAGYTNGQSDPLYRIPVFRFTSEDGLRLEGGNLYSQTEAAGKMEQGVAGTENYGTMHSNSLEQSNVDMSREMVNMIVVQRGFQSNSKSMQTIDTMIQKAIEMKR